MDFTTILHDLSLLDSEIQNFPSKKRILKLNADIVHIPLFKAALCKLQDWNEDNLTEVSAEKVFAFGNLSPNSSIGNKNGCTQKWL